MADGLGLLADGLEAREGVWPRPSTACAICATAWTELGRVRRAGSRMARRSVVWRRQEGPAVRESENAAHLDLLAGSCVDASARTAVLAEAAARRWLAPGVQVLGETLSDLAGQPGSHDVRQGAADAALAVARGLTGDDKPADPALDEAIAITRLVAADVMIFAGADAEEAVAATRAGRTDVEVPPPPSAARMPLPRPTGRRWRGIRSWLRSLRAKSSEMVRRRR